MRLNQKYLLEELQDDILVADPVGREVAVLSGNHAVVVKTLQSGNTVPQEFSREVDDLVLMGVVLPKKQRTSRREFISLGAAASAAGLVALAMPSAAHASSSVGTLSINSSCWSSDGIGLVTQGNVSFEPLGSIRGFTLTLSGTDPVDVNIDDDEVEVWDVNTGFFAIGLEEETDVTSLSIAVYTDRGTSNSVDMGEELDL